MTVNNIQEENNRLRSRLSALLAPKPTEQSQASADTETMSGALVDYGQLGKLQAELAAAKATLVDRELELARIKGADDDDDDVLRRDILHQNTTLQSAQAEVKALHSVIKQLRSERDSLARQRDVVSREIEARQSLREASGETPSLSTNARAAGVERALLELRGLVDGVIRSWDQVRFQLFTGPLTIDNNASQQPLRCQPIISITHRLDFPDTLHECQGMHM